MNKHCNCQFISECIEGIRIRCSDFEEKKKLLLEGIEFGYNKANEWAKEVGETEPDWGRKQIVRDFTEGFKFAKALYCKEEKKND